MWPRKAKPAPEFPTPRRWEFRPRADMTAQELALMLVQAGVLRNHFRFYDDEDPAVFFERQIGMPEIGRHFQESFFS